MPVFTPDRLTRPGMPAYEIGRGGSWVPRGTTRSSPHDTLRNWDALRHKLFSERASESLWFSDSPVFPDMHIC